jgi:hypothetical protein
MKADASRPNNNAGPPLSTKRWSAGRHAWNPDWLSQLALALQAFLEVGT